MTVNVCLVTREAVILGCDSVASSSRFLIDPFDEELQVKDGNGDPAFDDKGNPLISLKFEVGQDVVTDTYNGVVKMFKVYDRGGCVAAAVTAGIGVLRGRTIRNLAVEFCESQNSELHPLTSIEEVATKFRDFFKAHYEEEYRESSVPRKFLPDLEFSLGGFGTNDHLPSLYRVFIKSGEVLPAFKDGTQSPTGVAWGGQSTSVERLLLGFDSQVKNSVERSITTAFDQYRDNLQGVLVTAVENMRAQAGIEIANLEYQLPPTPAVTLPWKVGQADIDFGNIPLQDSVNFVSFLVSAESWFQRFRRGIPTVGGRTRVGVLRREGTVTFSMLNEPDMVNQFPGFDSV